MSDSSSRTEIGALPVVTIVIAGLGMGALGDLLLRAPGQPGLNFLLLFLALAVAIGFVSRRGGRTPSLEARIFLGAGVLLAAGMVWRDAPQLGFLAFLSAAAAFALPGLRAGAAWIRTSGVLEQMESIVGAGVYAAFGSFRLLMDPSWRSAESGTRMLAGWRRARSVLVGIVIALPFLVVFGALFMAADQVFAGIVQDLIRVNLEVVASHVVLGGILAWLACGYLSGFVVGTRLPRLREIPLLRPSLGILETGTALALIDILFLAFVVVQARYLFGGSGLIEVTPGLTYSEYARQGFAQLALASALVLPSLLAADALLRRKDARDESVFRVLGGLQLLLLLVIIASAIQRVRAYQAAYGLTELRLYGAAFLGSLALVTVWFGTTVLGGRKERFAFPTLVLGFALVAALHIANPDAWIARTNLARASDGSGAGAVMGDPGSGDRPPFDAEYLTSLSADAVPTLLEALPGLPRNAQCLLAMHLLDRWGPASPRLDWRSWSWSLARARSAVGAQAATLSSMVPPGESCG